MDSARVGPWVVRFDRAATARAYAALLQGDAAECACGDCLNWINQRARVLPKEFMDFLEMLGIDPEKETEISEYEGGMVDPKRAFYIGEYAFVGELDSGPDCLVEHEDRKGANYQFVSLFGEVKVGISSNRAWLQRGRLPIPKEGAGVIMFQVHAPRSDA